MCNRRYLSTLSLTTQTSPACYAQLFLDVVVSASGLSRDGWKEQAIVSAAQVSRTTSQDEAVAQVKAKIASAAGPEDVLSSFARQ